MSSPSSPSAKNTSNLGINFDEEYDSDEVAMKSYKAREADVRSITSTAISPEEATNGSVDSKLLSVLTNRSYDVIVRSAQDNATKLYMSNLTPEMTFLLKNHLTIQKVYGTNQDDEQNWKIDTDNSTDEEIFREISRLKKKLERIQQENAELEREKEQNQNKLQIIHSQNEKLERLEPLE